MPAWLIDARSTLLLWHSPARLHDLARRWRAERCDAARDAYEILQAWELRDRHLYDYERGCRDSALRWRKDFYRKLAVGWARRYRHVILDDRDLSREARWGEASDLRFLASPFEFRECLRQAFGTDVVEHVYPAEDGDMRDYCERALAAWSTGAARARKKRKRVVHGAGGAWAARKEKKRAPRAEFGAARKETGNGAE